MARDRKNEVVCRCNQYPFPHRLFSGKCHGLHLVIEGYGSRECEHCVSNEPGYCEVETGQEKTVLCPIVTEFIDYHEIKLWNKYLNRKK